jgi:hypothetical protein
MTPNQLLKKLTQLQNGKLNQIVDERLKKNEEIIVGLNQKQLMKGEFPSGQKTPEYRPLTLDIKIDANKLYGDGVHYSLRNDTDLYQQMYIEAEGGKVEINSGSLSSIKFDKWISRRRIQLSDFFGLNEGNFEQVKKKVEKEAGNDLNKYFDGV